MYYENDVGRIYYEVHGADNEDTLLFCHGVSMDHKTFLPQVEGLQDKYRLIIWDLPGHGQSSRIDDYRGYCAMAGTFVVELLAHLEVKKAVLVGQSLGSVIIQHAAHAVPERIAGTVHLGGAPLYPSFNGAIKVFNPLMAISITLLPGRLLYSAFAKHKALREETRAYLQEASSRAGKKLILHLSQEMIRDMVRGLPAPTEEPKLICFGDHEVFFLQKMARSWHDGTPGSQLAVINDAHHIANQDNAEAFNDLLSSFLGRISSHSETAGGG